jgi:hypothetical protein
MKRNASVVRAWLLCNILIGGKIIKELPGLVGGGTPYTVEPRFTNKFSEQKPSRMTNGVSDYEHASWQQRQAESISAGVSVAG